MASMIIVSGWRAGLVIGLIVTPLKIQHDGCSSPGRWTMTLRSLPTSEYAP